MLLGGLILSFGACGNEGKDTKTTTAENTPKITENDNKTEDGKLDPMKNYNILFIGNSYTYYNDMPEVIFKGITESAGYDFTVKQLTKGGWDLVRSGSDDDELGALVDAELKAVKYDFVVIQEQSTNPALDPGKFYDGARAVYAKVKENGATPILYSTWGRKKGHYVLEDNGLTNETMTWKIAAAYDAIGSELGADVAHVGLAFYDVYTQDIKGLDIYDADLTHPSYKGSYLAALTIFAKITGVDPTTVDFRGDCPLALAEIFKEAARKAVFETPAVPEEYKTSSEGIHMSEK